MDLFIRQRVETSIPSMLDPFLALLILSVVLVPGSLLLSRRHSDHNLKIDLPLWLAFYLGIISFFVGTLGLFYFLGQAGR
ncbi:MAG TPA: hypothetical protein VE975_03755 [Actinomycetota bacterium]|jgi:hypothetical protein|nr:hypothetical protein [Actinomycetota bacterium]